MQRLTLPLSSLYADHHVIEVRRILFAMPGVADVFASSAFQVVEVTYDPAVIDPQSIEAALAGAGYSNDFAAPTETQVSDRSEDTMKPSFRHTAAYRQVGTSISFVQNTSYLGRPLWPCPGMGTIRAERHEEDIGYG